MWEEVSYIPLRGKVFLVHFIDENAEPQRGDSKRTGLGRGGKGLQAPGGGDSERRFFLPHHIVTMNEV